MKKAIFSAILKSFDFVDLPKGSWGLHFDDTFRELLMQHEELEAQNETSSVHVKIKKMIFQGENYSVK